MLEIIPQSRILAGDHYLGMVALVHGCGLQGRLESVEAQPGWGLVCDDNSMAAGELSSGTEQEGRAGGSSRRIQQEDSARRTEKL